MISSFFPFYFAISVFKVQSSECVILFVEFVNSHIEDKRTRIWIICLFFTARAFVNSHSEKKY